jgi:sulfite exporter TauE/SafE
MEYVVAILSGFTLGTLHAFDPDHLAAVTTFASTQPDARKSSMFGLVWGFGHSITLFLFGLLAISFRFVIPPLAESLAETAVGLILVGIGVWALRNVFIRKSIHVHKHTHDGVEHLHFHSHAEGAHHRHRHSMFLVGAAHGLAGTASVLVLIPVTLSRSILSAVLYLVLFGVGTMAAMGSFAYFLGFVSKFAQTRKALPVVQGIAGTASIVIGLVWISGIFIP